MAWVGWADGDVFVGFGDGLDDDDDAFDAALCARNATNKFARKGLLVGISIVAMNRPLMRRCKFRVAGTSARVGECGGVRGAG